MKLRARLLAAFAVVLTVAAGVSLLVTPIPLRDRLLAFGVVIVVGLVIAFAVAEMLARPLGDLSETASRVAKGDLTARAHARSDDELGALAASLNEIVENLRAQTTEADTSRDEVRRSVRRLGEALRVTHVDMRKMLSVVLETALVAVEGKAGAVFLLSARRSEVYVKVGRHLAPQIAEQRIPLGRGLVGWAAEHRQAVLIPSTDAPVPEDPEPTEATALAVPLESQSQLLGVLVIYGRTNSVPFGNEDLETITSLARQAGVGIENVLLHQEAQRLSITDGLTGIWNYRYFQMQMAQHFAAAVRFEHRLSLLVIDIDRFKDVNDRYGHQRGDTTLIELARRVVMHTRLNIDTLARYGGEEFVLILPETGLQGARIVAEKIREEVAATPFGEDGDEPIGVSVSIGYASYPEHGLTQQALVDAADKAMYEAKARGRNRVVGAEELGF
ncbi:MAG: diguanylate cyclase [Actinobacteria bacterium]|nr:MAG: diguanylate cyclase [Actinomycetota bacterium]